MTQENISSRSKRNLPRGARVSTGARHQNLRQALINSAMDAISLNGVGSLRTRDLVSSVGCSLGAIYTVFSDLEEIIIAVNTSTLVAINAVMEKPTAGDPMAQLEGLAQNYLSYAMKHRRCWDALFIFRVASGKTLPASFLEAQLTAFSHIERPLKALLPDLSAEQLKLVSRSLFAAVHGVVAIGLEQRLADIGVRGLRHQVRLIVRAIAIGLEKRPYGMQQV